MQVNVNGAPHTVPDAASLRELLDLLQMAGQRLAVEINGAIVPRSRHAEQVLHDGDAIVIVQAIGGG